MAQLSTSAIIPTQTNRVREADGWREGKPVEDPEKTKRWGFVTARPSEYLVHVRRGRVLARTSGQGASCFKRPRDAVSVIPTSLQRLQFRADQVSAEKVGVEVVGLAVYRIAEPLLAYRLLNFSFPERAQEKLEQTLASMFIGAARRLIANLSVDDCLQKRKSGIAAELMQEIEPIVGGCGRPDDATHQGWGVVIDTIEIQEVRVLSDRVFAAMQAPYRAALDRQAREAHTLAERDVATSEAQCRRETQEAGILADEAIRERRAQASLAAAEQEARDAVRQAELLTRREQAQVEAKRQTEEARLRAKELLRQREIALELAQLRAKTELAVHHYELLSQEADAEQAVHEVRSGALHQRSELSRAEAGLRAELRRAEIDTTLLDGRARAEVEAQLAEVEQKRAEAQARVMTAEKLPELAAAVGQRIGEVRISQFGNNGANPFESITQAVAAVIDMARST